LKTVSFPWSADDLGLFHKLTDLNNALPIIDYSQSADVNEAPTAMRFLGLLHPLGMVDRSVLSFIGDPTALGQVRNERMTAYLKRVHRHPFMQWLIQQPDFVAAQASFQKRLQDKRPHAFKLADWPMLQFLDCAGLIGGYAWLLAAEYVPNEPSKRDLEQALARSTQLLKSLQVGVGMTSRQESVQFAVLLRKLESELREKVRNYRKPYSDNLVMGREFVEIVTDRFLSLFQEVSPKIIVLFASVVGYQVDATNIERQIKSARKTFETRRTDNLVRAISQQSRKK